MDDYISRDEARKAFLKALSKNSDREKSAIDWHNCKVILGSIPAADVRPVVRCKDCKYYKDGKLLGPSKFCYFYQIGTGLNTADDDFCSHGKRRAGNG